MFATVIDETLVRLLVATQFPQWKDLAIKPVVFSGWDNRTFHLGEDMLVRLPSAEDYSLQVEKEQRWLPILAPHLPLAIPVPLAMGKPSADYPWHWSIYRWLLGETASVAEIADKSEFAKGLAEFLLALQSIDATAGPLPGKHSFYRGGALSTYDTETRQAIARLQTKVDAVSVTAIWEQALASSWQGPAVWVHGDVSPGNLLLVNGRLTAVIDFGQLTTGDPACDLAIAWTFFQGENRKVFRRARMLDKDTWSRARGWALWKALIVCAGAPGTDPLQIEKSWAVLNEVLADEVDISDSLIPDQD